MMSDYEAELLQRRLQRTTRSLQLMRVAAGGGILLAILAGLRCLLEAL